MDLRCGHKREPRFVRAVWSFWQQPDSKPEPGLQQVAERPAVQLSKGPRRQIIIIINSSNCETNGNHRESSSPAICFEATY